VRHIGAGQRWFVTLAVAGGCLLMIRIAVALARLADAR
jgi:hypothetical protein